MRNSWLDFKLGARMLVKYPGLTLIGGFGMAVTIAISTGFFVFFYSFMYPSALPLNEGDRIVGIMNWDAAGNRADARSLHDFVTWREELTLFEGVGAYRPIRRNLIVVGRATQMVRGAEITAAGLRLARVPPLLGRLLLDEDERRGAPEVVVLGYDVWRSQFSADPSIVGQTVRLGATVHTVVGVMPEGFAFPVSDHLWLPLRAEPSDYARRQGPELEVFGRLAPGATTDSAQAELTAVGDRTAASFPDTHRTLRPRVVPYTALFFNEANLWRVNVIQLLVTSLLIVVSINVASLVYARTATRQSEIAVRSALGASRRRIVAQLFAEAFVLSALAAVLGLLLAQSALSYVSGVIEQLGDVPFWLDFRLSWNVAIYVAGLAVLGAVIVGVLPAMQATGRRVQAGLRNLGGGTDITLGRTWTALVVAQVAFAVAVLPVALSSGWQLIRSGTAAHPFAADEFLTARVVVDEQTSPSDGADAYRQEFAARYAARLAELKDRLEADPRVAGVTFSSQYPTDEAPALIETEGSSSQSQSGTNIRVGRVDLDFFGTFEVPLLAGRTFQSGDQDEGATSVIVNQAFVQTVLGGGNPLGRRVRYVRYSVEGGEVPFDRDTQRWYEIVGVVGNFPVQHVEPAQVEAKLYHAIALDRLYPARLSVHIRGTPAATFAGSLYEMTTALDPAMRPQDVWSMDYVFDEEQRGMRRGALLVSLVMGSVLLLSAAGVYTLMAFTVAQRRREIGIRVALGADAMRILRIVLSRALLQLAIGTAIGIAVAAGVARLSDGFLFGARPIVVLPAIAALMLAVGLLAAIGPARRGLRIQPTEALKAEV